MKSQKKHEDAGVIIISYMNRLPVELWWQILSLLPVKTLLILRAVCKWFLSIVNDSNFVSLHLHQFPDNALQTKILIVQCFIHYNDTRRFEASSVNSIDGPIIVDEFIHEKKRCQIWYCIGFLDGLFLFTVSYQGFEDDVILWNPSIRKRIMLSPPSEPPVCSCFRDFILGYHKSCNDYKVVSMDDLGAWIYSLKTRSWTDIALHSGLRRKSLQRYQVISEDCDYLLAFDQGVVWIETKLLVLFDFGSLQFRYSDDIFYPIDHKYRFPDIGRGLIKLDGGSSVGLWGTDVEDQPYVWALNTDSMSWTKRYKISQELVQFWVGVYGPQIVERNGELVWKSYSSESLAILSYDIGTRVIKSHLRFPESSRDFPESSRDFYIESLFMLN